MSQPAISRLTNSPLRNRIRLALSAPKQDVWSLVADLPRLTEYSAGLHRVDVTNRRDGSPAEFVCHFKPAAAGAASITHREAIRWFESGHGYAASPDINNAFGLREALNILTVDPHPDGTLLTWDEYFNAEDVEFTRTAYDQAFSDIAERLIARFGGRVVERYAGDGVNGSESISDPAGTVAAFVRAMNRGDLNAALGFYTQDAVLLSQPNQLARGIDEISAALRSFIALRPTLVTEAASTWLAGDVALYVGRWSLTGVASDGGVVNMRGESTDVLHRLDDRWLIAVDNPWGASALG